MEKIVVANLKMNLNENDVKLYIKKIREFNSKKVSLYIAPSFIYLEKFLSNKYHLAAQNVSFESFGEFTGEISSSQLKSIGVDSVIIGHSERRNLFKEDYQIINKKIKHSLKEGLNVILCIGEKEEGKLNDMFEELKKDLNDIILKNIIIAYEPEYCIGTGKTASLSHIKKVYDSIKEKYDTKVIYGGSVNDANIAEICNITDGVMIGKSSLNASKLLIMIEKID